MANKQLKNWLKNPKRDYSEGVQLFKELSVDATKNEFFNQNEPALIHRNLLFTLLLNYDRVHNQGKTEEKEKLTPPKTENKPSKVLKLAQKTIQDAEKELESGRIKIDKTRVNYDDLPEDLQKAYDENGAKYSEIKTLHAKLKAVPEGKENDEERKQLVNDMLDLQKQVKANWEKLDKYATTGNTPGDDFVQPEKASGAFSQADIEKINDVVIREKSKDMRIEANLAYIRRNKDNDKHKAKVEVRIAELEAWGINYEEKLK